MGDWNSEKETFPLAVSALQTLRVQIQGCLTVKASSQIESMLQQN